jgi:hypothetical protein
VAGNFGKDDRYDHYQHRLYGFNCDQGQRAHINEERTAGFPEFNVSFDVAYQVHFHSLIIASHLMAYLHLPNLWLPPLSDAMQKSKIES